MGEGTPVTHWRNLTLLGAFTRQGMLTLISIEAATDGEVFLTWLKKQVCPRLRPGQTVMMDNLGAHKAQGVRPCIEACQARLLYLPPCSPDLNPIEQAWSKTKPYLRAAKARTLAPLQQALSQALATLSPQDASAWFRHCGYGIQ